MELSELAAYVAPSGLLDEDELLELYTYAASPSGGENEEQELASVCGYSTKCRQGGLVAKDSKVSGKLSSLPSAFFFFFFFFSFFIFFFFAFSCSVCDIRVFDSATAVCGGGRVTMFVVALETL